MEITVFGRTIHVFTAVQINKLKELVFVTIGTNGWYRFAVLCFCIYLLINVISNKKRNRWKDKGNLMKAGIIIYVVFLLSALVFSRPAGERSMISWNKNFFMTHKGFHETTLVMVLIKFCMVVPFGAALKKAYYKVRIAVLTVAAMLTGIIIECMKYFLGRGKAAIGSAILLAAGTLIGVCGESILIKLRNYRGKG